MPEVADIFRLYGDAYLQRHGNALLPSHRRAIADLAQCRTPALGGHVLGCQSCGGVQYLYHSCLNRSCPKCHAARTRLWLDHQRQRLLPVPHFHLVFTLPEPLRQIVRRHQRQLLPLLFRAAADSLLALAKDKRYVGGTLAILAVLHTWGRTLVYHPHVHCLIAAGGLDPKGHWRHARRRFLVPVRPLSILFRAKFMALARKALPKQCFPQSLWKHHWVVHAKPSLKRPDYVLNYLARYVRRVAISNHRILAVGHGRVTFRYRDSRDGQSKTMTLTADEFMRRFLQHVLPAGLHKVRAYGLLSPAYSRHLQHLHQSLAPPTPSAPPNPQHSPTATPSSPPPPPPDHRCPLCGGLLLIIVTLPRISRSPP